MVSRDIISLIIIFLENLLKYYFPEKVSLDSNRLGQSLANNGKHLDSILGYYFPGYYFPKIMVSTVTMSLDTLKVTTIIRGIILKE